jgi:hypothetical protein
MANTASIGEFGNSPLSDPMDKHYRLEALRLAQVAAGDHEPASAIVMRAEAFYAFLTGMVSKELTHG